MTSEAMENLIQRQADSYNSRDLDTFCACYHPEVEVYRNVGEPASVKGISDFRKSYKERFESSPGLHCAIKSRIVLSKTVVDEELVTGLAGSSAPLHVVAVYSFRDGLISHVWFAR
jgi:hypothetical protein